MEPEKPRTRFAPSPTGKLHFGNANTAVFNWLMARRYGGTVVLRIEDTDLDRSSGEFEEKLLDDLRWLGLDWDEGPDTGGPFGPYRQMERRDIYDEHAKKLLDSGAAYRCYCTREKLEQDRENQKKNKENIRYAGRCRDLTPDDWARLDAEGKPYTIRFKTPRGEKVVVKDLIRGDIEFASDELDDFIFIRSNGVPTFLLTNAVDDALMQISHVVRGEDHISNTPKQVLINRALGLNVPLYLHTAIILGPDRTKLSKRHGAVNVIQFREQGYLPEGLINYIAFLGWNPKDDREFFSLEQLQKEFSIEAMSKAPSVFDYDRLAYLNAHWMKEIDRERLVDLCAARLVEAGFVSEEDAVSQRDFIAGIVEVAGERLKTVNDIDAQSDFYFKDITEYEEKGVKKFFKPEQADVLRMFADSFKNVEPFAQQGLEDVVRALMEQKELPGKKVFQPLRLSLTGKLVGPGLFELIELLGRDTVLARLEAAAQWINDNVKPAEA